MIRRPPRSTQSRSSAASDVYKRQLTPPASTTSRWTHPPPVTNRPVLRMCRRSTQFPATRALVRPDPTGPVTRRLKIRRFLPEQDAEPHWETYTVPTEQGDRLLDAIHWVKWNLDGSLTFRRSCAHGVCGSDAMRVNGVNRLACKVLTKDLGDEVTLEPIKGLPVLKDLVVDMEPFFEAYRSVRPFLIPGPHEPTKERLQSARDRERFDDTTKCILCAACTTSCPVYWSDDAYFGPCLLYTSP